MKMLRLRPQRGVGHLVVLLACLIIVVIFAAGWTVASKQKDDGSAPRDLPSARTPADTDDEQKPSETAGSWVRRQEAGIETWQYLGGTPPSCPSPLLKISPADTTKATDIGMPGQYRGTHYKAHGGIRFDGSQAEEVTVRLPIDAKLIGLKRYLEMGELQYLLDFEHPCGIQIRFDHLATLSPDFAKIADTTPEPTDDTRGLPAPELFGQEFKAGVTVATAVGLPKASNIGFDFGVYDIRQQNKISRNAKWAELHRNESSQTFYGVCWLPMLPSPHAAKLKSLYGSNPTIKYISDYCTDAPDGGTLQYNDGRAPQS